jgi:hypothetical protein
MSIEPKDWEHFGQAGHLCVANWCRFHMHTHVGRYCVSTVGDWHLPQASEKESEPRDIGYGRLYETMVFTLGDDNEPTDIGNPLDFAGYNSRTDANAGHLEMCRKWSTPVQP